MLDIICRAPFIRLLALVCLCLSGCGSTDNAPSASQLLNSLHPYRIDIIQGNVVTREQLALLKPGLTREQVRDVLGTSLLTSVFHADRWNYVFTIRRSGEEPLSRKVVVHFKDNLLAKIEADELPSEAEFAATLKSDAKIGKLPPLEASDERLKDFPPPAPATPEPVAPAGNPAYPPLEPLNK